MRLHSTGQWRALLDNGEHERFAGEEPTLYHLLKMRRRQESRVIHGVQDRDGKIHISTKDLLRTFVLFVRKKYGAIAVNEDSVNCMARVGKKTLPQG